MRLFSLDREYRYQRPYDTVFTAEMFLGIKKTIYDFPEVGNTNYHP